MDTSDGSWRCCAASRTSFTFSAVSWHCMMAEADELRRHREGNQAYCSRIRMEYGSTRRNYWAAWAVLSPQGIFGNGVLSLDSIFVFFSSNNFERDHMDDLSIKRNLLSSYERGMGLPVNHVERKLPFSTSPASSTLTPQGPGSLKTVCPSLMLRLAHIRLYLTAKRTDGNNSN